MMRIRRNLVGFMLATLTIAASFADDAVIRKNWFNDPFFNVANDIADCPAPRGPRMTHSEMQGYAHSRAEFGTTCWLTGKCEKSNFYQYDTDISQELRRRFKQSDRFKNATLWIWMRARVVWVEGCVGEDFDERALEEFVKAIPEVRFVVPNLTCGSRGKPAYPIAEPGIDQ